MSTNLNTFHGVSLHISVTIAPEHIDEFLSHFKTCLGFVSAEPECLFFEIFHDAENPGHFHWVEDWNKDLEVRYISELLFPSRILFWVAECRRSRHFGQPLVVQPISPLYSGACTEMLTRKLASGS